MNTTPIAPDRDQWPTRSDLLDESSPFENMTPCPRGCGAHFHGKITAFHSHMANSECPNLWV